MTARGLYALVFGAVMLATGLSVGSACAYTLGAVTLLACAYALLSVLLSCATCRLTQQVDGWQSLRGLPCAYRVTVRMASLLPIAPLSLRVTLPSGRQSEFTLRARTLGETHSENAFACPHVGVFPVGITRVRFRDCFDLFSLSHGVRAPLPELTVLPNPAPAELPAFSPGEGEAIAWQRALADHTTPSDTRAWQQGDELKRVHWKLSMRKQTLMVRTYETPQRPDALILLDLCAPAVPGALRAAAVDALTEGCAGVVRLLLAEGHPVRIPMPGKGARELSAEKPNAFPAVQAALAACAGGAREADFSRALRAAARRVRRSGAAVVLTAHLTPAVADAAIALRRTGPRTRLTLYTPGEPSDEQRRLLRLLASSGVEAGYASFAAAREEKAG